MRSFEQAATSYAVLQGLKLRMKECVQRAADCSELNIDYSFWSAEYKDAKEAVKALFGEVTAERFEAEVKHECTADA